MRGVKTKKKTIDKHKITLEHLKFFATVIAVILAGYQLWVNTKQIESIKQKEIFSKTMTLVDKIEEVMSEPEMQNIIYYSNHPSISQLKQLQKIESLIALIGVHLKNNAIDEEIILPIIVKYNLHTIFEKIAKLCVNSLQAKNKPHELQKVSVYYAINSIYLNSFLMFTKEKVDSFITESLGKAIKNNMIIANEDLSNEEMDLTISSFNADKKQATSIRESVFKKRLKRTQNIDNDIADEAIRILREQGKIL